MNIKYPRIWIAAHGGPQVAAKAKDTPPGILAVLAFGDDKVRHAVAGNEHTPPEVLRKLVDFDDDELVKAAAVKNRALPVDMMARLTTHESWDVRYALARNPSLPLKLLKWLARDDPRMVVRTMAQTKLKERGVDDV